MGETTETPEPEPDAPALDKVRWQVRLAVNSPVFGQFILLVIFLNTVMMATENSPAVLPLASSGRAEKLYLPSCTKVDKAARAHAKQHTPRPRESASG